MKVSHVIGSCTMGGDIMLTKALLVELKKCGLDVGLWIMTPIKHLGNSNPFALDFEKNLINELEDNGITVTFLGKRSKKDWRMCKNKIRELFRESNSNIVHSHLETVSFHVCRALRNFNVPLVQTVHSTKIYHPLVGKYYMKKCFSRYVAISQKVSEIIKDTIGIQEYRIRPIFNGIDLQRFSEIRRSIKKNRVKTIISVGRLDPSKDYFNLLESFSILKKSLRESNSSIPNLWIVGEGFLKTEIESRIRTLNLKEHVTLLGLREDIPELLSQAEIYVMGSEWEGLSLSLIEAQAAGLPIVATDAGSNCEIVQNGVSGLIVPCKDPGALAEGILKLINNEKTRHNFSINAKKRSEEFSIQTCAKKHIELYKELVDN